MSTTDYYSHIRMHCINNPLHVLQDALQSAKLDPSIALRLFPEHKYTPVTISKHTHNVRDTVSNSCSYNYIFKVLFTTPSWYVFSIGFGHMSKFRWDLAPNHIPIRRNAIQVVHTVNNCRQIVHGAITLARSVLQIEQTCANINNAFDATFQWTNHKFQLWCNPHSFAMTDGIHCCTFSSAYRYA